MNEIEVFLDCFGAKAPRKDGGEKIPMSSSRGPKGVVAIQFLN